MIKIAKPIPKIQYKQLNDDQLYYISKVIEATKDKTSNAITINISITKGIITITQRILND